jgi:regulator of replication initiation timing
LTEKDGREIKKIIKQLETIYDQIPDDKQKLAKGLIENIAWQVVQLKILRKQIDEFGLVYQYSNGKQQLTAESPYSKAYNALYPKYLASIKQLNDMLPASAVPEKNEITDFFNTVKQ